MQPNFVKPIHWKKATGFPESATHAVDFSPGRMSGIGPLMARNLDGQGVHVIMVGEHGKGDVELFECASVKYDDWQSKKWLPGLVHTR
jgi:fatty acid synthase subunit alpha, fungi type